MKIRKVINNNIVSSLDNRGREVILMGKGLGFQKKVNDEINAGNIEKIFELPEKNTGTFAELVKDMPYEHIRLAEEIIAHADSYLKFKLNKNIYITLTDHLNYAIERHKQGIIIENAFMWEIQRYYPDEFQMGEEVLEIVKEKIGIELSIHEAAFFALHFLNAEMNGNISQSASMPGIVSDIINIVRDELNGKLDETSLNYQRLVTHLKFFLQRVIQNTTIEQKSDGVCLAIKEFCKNETPIVDRISAYVKEKMGYDVSEEEQSYLLIYIHRIAIE